jgi:hypothetical protein
MPSAIFLRSRPPLLQRRGITAVLRFHSFGNTLVVRYIKVSS